MDLKWILSVLALGLLAHPGSSIALEDNPKKNAPPSPLERLKIQFEQAEPAKISDLPPGDSTWAGRCLSEGAPRRRYGFLVSFYRVHDPVLNDFIYGLSLTHASPRYFHGLRQPAVARLRQELVTQQLDYYTEISEEPTGLKALAEFPRGKGRWRAEVTASESSFSQGYDIRAKHVSGKPLVLFFRLICRDQFACEDTFGYHAGSKVYRDDAGAWCYLDQQLL